ncbi:amino acid ABC transporter permease [Corynebacterium marinum]|jgi:glutamate transport system permease protein|uniref:Glutamate transport system permease protein GluD n=3 Tax=Corynebacterium marinum TaxID=349751 RepID=A0A0B6TU09_9CORY|nr:amino acid ABC transporter permease [Corynebacterium marinum]AJK69090.1 Glutamate transport system permease protein GluD [Corynebacterium marinum DSM 44953]GGO17749.1 glutamate transport system permease protein GluD [Corynebacterium marinum]
MAVRATVLYDAPGPRGRRINSLLTILAAAVTLLAVGWIGWTLNNNGQLTAAKWTPFLDSQTWQTYILPGLWGTLRSAFVSIILAMVLGVLLGLGRLSELAWLRWICAVIVEFFRAIPVLLLMIFAYQLFAVYNMVPPRQLAFAAVVFGLTMYNGSVVAEILRSGIKSLPKGQTEAARALGLSHQQTMRTILLPQAIAAMLPALIAQMVIALKDSALGYQIGYVEVVRSGIQSASVNQNFLASLTVVAMIMILINWALTSLAQRVERQLRAGRARRNILAKVPEMPDQGLETKDNVNVDWHDPDYVEIKNPGQ